MAPSSVYITHSLLTVEILLMNRVVRQVVVATPLMSALLLLGRPPALWYSEDGRQSNPLGS